MRGLSWVVLLALWGAGCGDELPGDEDSGDREPTAGDCEPDWQQVVDDDAVGTLCVEDAVLPDEPLEVMVVGPACFGSGGGSSASCSATLIDGEVLVTAEFLRTTDLNECPEGSNTDACFGTVARCTLEEGLPAGTWTLALDEAVLVLEVPSTPTCDETTTEY